MALRHIGLEVRLDMPVGPNRKILETLELQSVRTDAIAHANAQMSGPLDQHDAEKIVLDAVRQQGLPAVILRPGQIFGAGAEKVAPSGTIAIAGRWVVIGSGKLRLPLVYVEDVVDALLLAEQGNHLSGSVFHLVDPTMVTQNEYLELCRKVPGNALRIWRLPWKVCFWS